MRKRIVAGAAGAAVALGFYVLIGSLQPAAATRAMSPATAPHPAATGGPSTYVAPVDPTPARLLIPTIGVDARVEARGLDASRNLDTAADYRDVAWYDLGPRPGEPGNAIVNGHVNWWTGDAVFTNLSRLRTGDVIRVVRADGGVIAFRVTGKQVVDANARIAALFAPSAQPTLTLITCSGVWNPFTQSDTRRLLVRASLV